ncbi:hypothetical protein G7Y79_00019g046720 [Physcia stellaris]|nr:hypothetical protein G7Y79_00019g046720 [Physcia stellaris]
MKSEETTSITPFETSSTILFSPSITVRLPPPSAYQEAKFRNMARPIINKEAIKAAFEAALNPDLRQAALPSTLNRKRRASEILEMPRPSWLERKQRYEIPRSDAERFLLLLETHYTENLKYSEIHGTSCPDADDVQGSNVVAGHIRTGDNSQEAPPEIGDMALAVQGENSSEEGFRVPSPQDGDSEQEAIEEESDDRRRYESDCMLAQAYRELSEASRDMATWSHATSVALEEKLAAERRELDAAAQVLMAQARYKEATEKISQAAAHRYG